MHCSTFALIFFTTGFLYMFFLSFCCSAQENRDLGFDTVSAKHRRHHYIMHMHCSTLARSFFTTGFLYISFHLFTS